MEREHCSSVDSQIEFTAGHSGITSTSEIEWHFVVDPHNGLEKLGLDAWPSETNARLDDHHREPRTLEEFNETLGDINARLEEIGIPGLTTDELIACRLYTGPLGVKYNSMVRAYTAPHQPWRLEYLNQYCKDNRYPTTIFVLQSAVSKLGKICPVETVYYGMSGAVLPEHYWVKDATALIQGGVEGSFTSATAKYEVALQYARASEKTMPGPGNRSAKDGGHFGILLQINMPVIDRGADLSWLSQYPFEDEILLPALTFHMVEELMPDPNNESILLAKTTCRLSVESVMRPLLTMSESKVLRDALSVTAEPEMQSRFSAANSYFVAGNPLEAVLGMSHLLKVDEATLNDGKREGIAAIEREVQEFGSAELEECLHYVLYEPVSEKMFPNGLRDQGRKEKSIDDFINHPIAKHSNLEAAHVVALRLYTTAAFKYINSPLRDHDSEEPHPLPVTVAFVTEAIRRLRAEYDPTTQDDTILWRGVKNTLIASEFVDQKMGGTELGLMSTTTDLRLAASYSSSSRGLLLKIKLSNLMQFGASVAWVSAFPRENEILYPPLTYLQPTGAVDSFKLDQIQLTVIEVKPYV